MSSLILIGDLHSQPSRAIWALATIEADKMGPWTMKQINLGKKEHLTREMRQLNPSLKAPAMIDGDFKMFESHAILKYLCYSRDLPDHWYPKQDLI